MTEILDLLIQPLRYPFMVRGLLASVMVGTLCAVVGTYVVLRGMAFFGDALAHAILPGVAIAYLLDAQPLLGRPGHGPADGRGHRLPEPAGPGQGGHGHRRDLCRQFCPGRGPPVHGAEL